MPGPPRRPIPLAIIPRAPAWLPFRVPPSIGILPHPIALVGVPPHPGLPHVVVPPVVTLFFLFVTRWNWWSSTHDGLWNWWSFEVIVFVANVPRKGISADLRTGRAIMR